VPGAIWEIAKVDWTFVRVLQHADARRAAIRPDPDSMLVVLVAVWMAAVLATTYLISSRRRRASR
jgi:hypothetical protein